VAGARATVDGADVALGEPVALDPGEHEVRVIAGDRRASKKVVARQGDGTSRVVLDLGGSDPVDGGPDGYVILGVSLTAVGGAALVVGGIVGVVALDEAAAAEERLPVTCTADGECLPGDRAAVEAEYETAYGLGTAADVLLVGGAVAAAAGVVILIVDPGASSASPSRGARGTGGLRIAF
jgi:hypothetical protein